MFFRFFLYIGILVCPSAYATESDNYTQRKLILSKANAAPVVEKMINTLISDAVKESNEQGTDVVENIRKRLATENFSLIGTVAQSLSPFKMYGIPVTPLEWVLDQQNIKKYQLSRSSGPFDVVARPAIQSIQQDKWGEHFKPLLGQQFPLEKYGHRVRLEDSIFKELSIFESGLTGMPGIMFVASLNIDGNVVGIDKLGHFFAQGYTYFETLKGGRSLQQILKDGKFEEEAALGRGAFGLSAFGSGVISYADLAANFYGLHFWQQLLGGKKPLLNSKDGVITQIRKFKFSDYPTYAMDEAINISSHHGLVAKDIQASIKELGYQWDASVNLKKAAKLSALNCASFYTAPMLSSRSSCMGLKKIGGSEPQ